MFIHLKIFVFMTSWLNEIILRGDSYQLLVGILKELFKLCNHFFLYSFN